MRKLLTLFTLLLISFNTFAQADESENSNYFITYPQISPDGKTSYFVYDGDLWQYNLINQQSARLTNMDGRVSHVKLSPNGEKIAFSATQYGNSDVFLLDIKTGKIKQMSYHQAPNEVTGWSWDGENIYFSSTRYNMSASFVVNISGGTAKRVFHHYFNITNQLTGHPDGGYIFTMGMEAAGQLSRKRYKGPNNPEIYYYHPEKGKVYNQTNWEGKDLYASVDQQGNIYYQSDEHNGFNNLYVIKGQSKTRLTSFDEDIQMPAVNSSGSHVVYIKNYQLYLYDVAQQKSQLLNPLLNTYQDLKKLQSFRVADDISYFDVSPDASKLAFVSRGILFVSDIGGISIKKAWHSKERVFEVKWLADNERVIFSQTVNGYAQWFVLNVHQKDAQARQITSEPRTQQNISLNKKRTQAVYLSGRDELRIMNLSTFNSELIVKDEFWAFQTSTPHFSPNGQYVVYTGRRNFEEDLFAYDITTKKSINLTQTGVTETDPFWSPDGKYIYFTSDRTEQAYPYGLISPSIYRMAIDWYDKPYESDKLEEIFKEKQEELDPVDKAKKRRKKDKEVRQKEAVVLNKINPDGLRDRIDLASSGFGRQTDPFVTHLDKDQYLWYNSNEAGGKGKWFLHKYENYRHKEYKEVHDAYVSHVIEVQDKIYFLSRNKIYSLVPKTLKKDEIKLDFAFYKNLEEEFQQMFEETWAGIEENFYETNFHGIDWQAMKERYQALVPYVKNREELRVVLNDMLGELNSSHLGFRSIGREEMASLRYTTVETGIIYDEDNPWKIKDILRKSPAYLKESNLKVGDIILKVNDIEVNNNMNRDSVFSFPGMQKEIHLTVNRNGAQHISKLHPIDYLSFRNLLYDEWIYENEQYVAEKTNNEIAYVYMKNMSGESLEKFLLDMVAKDQNSKGLIFDLRFNTGGNVHDKVLQFLAQRPYLEWQYRDGKRAPQSTFAPSGKPIVLLINEGSLSDAEMTAGGFKALNLGTIIGNGTYRWIIFTSGKGLVDGSMYRIPAWGTYTLDGDNLEHTGVTPHIYVDIDLADREEGRDPQLDRAIQEVLK